MMLVPMKLAAIALVISTITPMTPVWPAAIIDTQDSVPPAICVLDATTRASERAAVLPPVAACTITNGSTLSQQS